MLEEALSGPEGAIGRSLSATSGGPGSLPGMTQNPEPIQRDELSPGEARIARAVLGPLHEWNPDIALRYLPIVRMIRDAGLEDEVTDIGSGPQGIAPYLRKRITGVDTDFFPKPHPLLEPVDASVLQTPFEDGSRPCVLSVDMLEHLPPHLREQAVDELVRITGKLLIIAVPAGAQSYAHDREMSELFRRSRGSDYLYLLEHLENGLPTDDQLRAWVAAAMKNHQREGRLELLPNANLRLREFIMRRWIRRGVLDKIAWVILTWMSPLLARFSSRPAYREIAVVRFA